MDHLLQPLEKPRDTTASERVGELLSDGIWQGVSHRLSQPEELAANAAVCAVLGYGLNMASRAGGRWGTVAKGLGGAFAIGMGIDVTRRAVPTAHAIYDTALSGDNLAQNKLIVANNLGTGIVDYTVMGLSGMGGFKLAGRIHGGAVPAELPNLSGRSTTPSTQTEALLSRGVPINPQTRALAAETAHLHPARQASLLKEMASVDATGMGYTNLGAGRLGDFQIAPGRMVSVSAMRFFPVVPVDLLSEVEKAKPVKLEAPRK